MTQVARGLANLRLPRFSRRRPKLRQSTNLASRVVVIMASQSASAAGIGHFSVDRSNDVHVETDKAYSKHAHSSSLHPMGTVACRTREAILNVAAVLGECDVGIHVDQIMALG